ARSVAWAPDSRRIAYLMADGSGVAVYDLVTGATQTIDAERVLAAPKFSPDGRHIAYFSATGTIGVADGDGSNPRVLVAIPGVVNDFHPPAWTLDGQRVIFNAFNQQSRED